MQTANKADVINTIRNFITSISERYKIQSVYLFGSYSVSEFQQDLTDIIVEVKQKGEKIA